MQGHGIQTRQYHQVSKMVFSLIETWPGVSDNLSFNSTCISQDMNRYSSVNRRLRHKTHSSTDALTVKQSASWPYLTIQTSRWGHVPTFHSNACDIYIHTYIYIIYICIYIYMRMEDIEFLLKHSTMRSRKWMKNSGYGKLTEVVDIGPDPGHPRVSAKVRWTPLKILNDLDRDRHTFARTPMPMNSRQGKLYWKKHVI